MILWFLANKFSICETQRLISIKFRLSYTRLQRSRCIMLTIVCLCQQLLLGDTVVRKNQCGTISHGYFTMASSVWNGLIRKLCPQRMSLMWWKISETIKVFSSRQAKITLNFSFFLLDLNVSRQFDFWNFGIFFLFALYVELFWNIEHTCFEFYFLPS